MGTQMGDEGVRVVCGGCGQEIMLPPGTRSGDLIECAQCAGLSLQVSEQGGRWSAATLKTASCAVGDELVLLPDDVRPGDIVECHGVKQKVTHEYGAYALERVGGVQKMRIADLKSGFLAIVTASVSSLCCLLPLAVILMGLGSGAFMMTTMRYREIFIPVGVIGVGLGWLLHVHERRRCDALGCRMAGSALNLSLLLVASLVVAAAVALDQFPNVTADLLTRATARVSTAAPTAGSSGDHSTMKHGAGT